MTTKEFVAVSDKYNQDYFRTTLDEFLKGCDQSFGTRPNLHNQTRVNHLDEIYECFVDDDGEVVLSGDLEDLENC